MIARLQPATGARVNRRELIGFLGGAAGRWRVQRSSGRAGGRARIGYIGTNRQSSLGEAIYRSFLDEMNARGFIEGRNLQVEFRPIEQSATALDAAAGQLARANVNLIVTDGTEDALRAAIGASRSIPIVMVATNFDPLKKHYVESLARPGGNVTGVFLRQTDLAEKQTELLAQAVPSGRRVAVLWDAVSAEQFEAAERRAKALGLAVHSLKLERPPYDFDAAFRSLEKASPQMLLVLSSPYFPASRAKIAVLAIAHHLPTMFIFKTYVQAGGLMSYGADYVDMHRQIADYAAKILRGAKAADLPVEQPSKFEMVVNLGTAKALGI